MEASTSEGVAPIASKVIGTALEYLKTAEFAREQGHVRVCYDSLFNACELASKARLILMRTPATKAKTHRFIHSEINKWANLGNVNQEFITLFNRLSNSRSEAKYQFEFQD